MPTAVELYSLIEAWLPILGLLGALGIAAAGLYVYLFRQNPEWSKFTLWLSSEGNRPLPYGLTAVRFAQENAQLWRIGAWLSLLITAGAFYAWLLMLGLDPIRAVLGVWFLTWLPGLFGRFTTELGQTEPFGLALLTLSIASFDFAPWLGLVFALLASAFLPVAGLLASLCTWSFWPLVGLVLPFYRWFKHRHIELDGNAPSEIIKSSKLVKKFGFGAHRAGGLRDFHLMVRPWGCLAILFLVAAGQSASVPLLGAAFGALVVSYVMAYWSQRHTVNALIAAIPVIACAVSFESIEWILLAAFLQPFTASEGEV